MFAKKKSVSMKALVLLLAVVLLVGCVAGGTLAYLMTKTTPVTNTFVVGTIGELTLTESYNVDTNNDGKADKWEKTVVPGVNLTKDPTVSFRNSNVAAYVFVKVDASGWTRDATTGKFTPSGLSEMYWEIGTDWSYHTTEGNSSYIFFKAVDANSGLNASIIKDNTIFVPHTITEDDLENYIGTNLTFTAYAIQQDGFEGNIGNAWAQAKNAH